LVSGLPTRLYFEAVLPSGDPADVTVAVCPVLGGSTTEIDLAEEIIDHPVVVQ